MVRNEHREVDRIRSYYAQAGWRASRGRDFLVAERRATLTDVIERKLGKPTRLSFCDVGCGSGTDLEYWHQKGVPAASLFGTELLEGRAETARDRVPGASIASVAGFDVPFDDASMDVVTASLVLSSILDPAAQIGLLREMRRVLKPSGVLAIYDFRIRKPWNRRVVPVRDELLSDALGPPSHRYALAPLLPILDLALKLPSSARARFLSRLPRTHSLWVWNGR
jgi:ubiquinone/menaquinone biosynthesis C-methylase UbiE